MCGAGEGQFCFSQTTFPHNSSQEGSFNILVQLSFPLTLSKNKQKTNFQVQKNPPGLAEPSFCFLTNSLLTLKTKGVFSGTASGFRFDKNQLLCGLVQLLPFQSPVGGIYIGYKLWLFMLTLLLVIINDVIFSG